MLRPAPALGNCAAVPVKRFDSAGAPNGEWRAAAKPLGRSNSRGEIAMGRYSTIAALCALLSAAAHAQTPTGNAEHGKQVFIHQLCYTCHGTVGQGGERGAGPKLAPNPFPWQAFEMQVRKPRQAMPPYTAKNLPDQDLADIYAYIQSVKPPAALKDIPLLNP